MPPSSRALRSRLPSSALGLPPLGPAASCGDSSAVVFTPWSSRSRSFARSLTPSRIDLGSLPRLDSPDDGLIGLAPLRPDLLRDQSVAGLRGAPARGEPPAPQTRTRPPHSDPYAQQNVAESPSMESLRALLATLSPGPVPSSVPLDSVLASCWSELAGGDSHGMTADKLLGRMEDAIWDPPAVRFWLARHGAIVAGGSTRADKQHWTIDVDLRRATVEEHGFVQVHPSQPPLNLSPIVSELTALILSDTPDPRLQWDGPQRVRVLIGRILPEHSAVRRTLAGRRKRLITELQARLAPSGWIRRPGPQHVFERLSTPL